MAELVAAGALAGSAVSGNASLSGRGRDGGEGMIARRYPVVDGAEHRSISHGKNRGGAWT